MPKSGEHHGDADDGDVSKGNNNPDKSVTITTGTPKKKETFQKQAYAHEDGNKEPQAAKNEWKEDTRDKVNSISKEHDPKLRKGDRNGSDSNDS